MNTSTGMTMAPGSPMTAEKAQQLAVAQNNKVLQQQQQQAVMQLQQQALQQQQHQQQQQTIQQLHFQQQGMTISGMQQQQIVTGDRQIMPVVSMSAAPNNQQMQQAISQGIPQTLPLQPNLAVAQQQMTMPMQQIHPVCV